MRVQWTTTVAGDLAHIVEYIRKDDPLRPSRARNHFGSVFTIRFDVCERDRTTVVVHWNAH